MTYVVLSFLVFSTNFILFGDPLSPLEQQLMWIPVLRGPLFEEGCKLLSIYVIKRKEKVIGNRLLRRGGILGNWFFLFENFGYILTRNLSLSDTFIRMSPWHVVYTIFDTLGFRADFHRKRIIFPILAIILHGVTNYLSIRLEIFDYILYSVIASLSLFAIFLAISRENT